ncbi:hypothetical protein Zmor_022141 [Zophobas morio]|uniref:CRAL-TRIO domain-containing protein n=1 Tax=Zophobas morio TaxID=2755281 RepID=A0AA38M6H3_9CUCU|nr:hypothetical protein Zmor_022141 [Zophobas morio]
MYSPVEYIMLYFAMFEVRLFEDFMYNDVLIIDIENLGFEDLTKTTPTVLSKQVMLYKKVYSFRLKNLYFVNAPSFVSSLLTVIEAVVKSKIFERRNYANINNDLTIWTNLGLMRDSDLRS